MGAFIAWELNNNTSLPDWVGYIACIGFGGVVTLLYGVAFGPPLAGRDALTKAVATLGLALTAAIVFEASCQRFRARTFKVGRAGASTTRSFKLQAVLPPCGNT